MLDTRLDPLDAPALPPRRGFSIGTLALVLVVVVVAIAAGGYLWKLRHEVPAAAPAVQVPGPSAPAVAPQPDLGPAVQHPVSAIGPAAPAPAPLPALDESDLPLDTDLRALLPGGSFEALVNPERIARRVVATVDNLPRETLAPDARAVRPVPGHFLTNGSDTSLVINDANAARYAPYVDALSAVDSRRAVAVYVHYYPLLQQAYRDLGYPNGYFNDRLVAVLDDLLAAPQPAGPVALVQPKVVYQFADPTLESLSSGQKMMVRMGPANEARAKAKLAELRRLVAGQKP